MLKAPKVSRAQVRWAGRTVYEPERENCAYFAQFA